MSSRHPTDPVGRTVDEMLAIHAVLRRATEVLATAAQGSYAGPTKAARLEAFASWTAEAVAHHHNSEDNVFWPALRVVAPESAGLLSELTDQHDALHTTIADMVSAIGAVEHESLETDRLAATTARLRDALDAHLQAEEPQLAGLLRRLPPAQASEVSRTVARTAPRRSLPIFIGLVIDTTPSGQEPILFAHMPPPMRWARRPLYRRYRRDLSPLGADAQTSEAQ